MLRKQIAISAINIVGTVGGILVLYGLVARFTGQHWHPIEKITDWLAALCTISATLVIAGSVYLPMHTRPPDRHSKVMVAPTVIAFALASLVLMALWQDPLPGQMVSGFALLGLSGALFRILPFSEWPPETLQSRPNEEDQTAERADSQDKE